MLNKDVMQGDLSILQDQIIGMNSDVDSSQKNMNLSFEGNMVGIDIGGTLIKIVFAKNLALEFVKFDVHDMEAAILFSKKTLESYTGKEKKKLIATGGGAHKYSEHIRTQCCDPIGAEFIQLDEMQSLVQGFFFLISNVSRETCTFEGIDGSMLNELSSTPVTSAILSPVLEEALPLKSQDEILPCLLVNIGSGVSILKISGYDKYERVSGTSLGGGTFSGLVGALASSKSFDEALDLAGHGDGGKVDLLVGDIYGTDYGKMGLNAQMIASSFGKAQRGLKRDSTGKHSESIQTIALKEDMAASILHMVTINIGQISYLNARLHNIRRIYFSGYFIRGHALTMRKLAFAIHFWSSGTMKAFFLRHEGYLGALGSLLSESISI